jgi:hypothetical protein
MTNFSKVNLILVLARMFKVNTHSTPVESSRVQFLPFLKKLRFWFFKKKEWIQFWFWFHQKKP